MSSNQDNINRQVDPWGRVIFSSDDALEIMYQGHDMAGLLFQPDAETAAYNGWCEVFDKPGYRLDLPTPSLTPEAEQRRQEATWNMPEAFVNLDMEALLLERCMTEPAKARVRLEMTMYRDRGLEPLLRLMAALVAYFQDRKIVWGVGRGSSVSSYCLFLLKVHRVDSLKYDLDIAEFLK